MDMLWKLFQILTFFAAHLQRHLQVLWFLTLHFLMNPSRGAELHVWSRVLAGSAFPPWGFREWEESFARCSEQNNSAK